MFDRFFNRETMARQAVVDALPKHAVGVEIGVWKGDFSALLLKKTAPKTLHLIDPWMVADDAEHSQEAWYGSDKITQPGMDDIHDAVARRFQSECRSGQVVIHRRPSAEAMAAMDEESVDYVYIDGDHSFEGVDADLHAAYRITKPGGMICCDDYFLGAWWKDGVIRAVHNFLAAYPIVIHSKANSQIVMRKRRDG